MAEPAVTSPQDVVTAMYQKVRAGALDEARALWSDTGVWHVTGSHALAGDYDPHQYISFVQQLFRDYPDYRGEWLDVRSYDGTIVVAHLRSTGGAAPGTVGGILVVRVGEGRIQEGWGIPAVADRPF